MYTKNPLVTTTLKMVKKGINQMKKKPKVVKEAITHPITTNKIDTINERDKRQASQSKKDKSTRNKSNKSRSLDKSRSTQRTETENTVKH